MSLRDTHACLKHMLSRRNLALRAKSARRINSVLSLYMYKLKIELMRRGDFSLLGIFRRDSGGFKNPKKRVELRL